MTELPTKQDLNELEALLAKSTPGAWKTWALDVMADQVGDSDVDKAVFVARGAGPRTFDIDLICAMQRALPALIAAARELEELKAKPAGDWEEGAMYACDYFGLSYSDLPEPTNGR